MKQLKTLKILMKFQICAMDLRMKLKLMTLKILNQILKSLMKVHFQGLIMKIKKLKTNFCKVVLYTLRFDKTELKGTCNNEEFEKIK